MTTLKAVSTLRRVRFPVEEIGRMQQDPACIPEVIRDYGESIEETYAALGRIRELLRQGDLRSAENIYAQSFKLNGEELHDTHLPFQSFQKGGTLDVVMGATPVDEY